MPFGVWSTVDSRDPRNHVLDGGPNSPTVLRRWRGSVWFIFPSVTPYTSLFSLSTLVYLQHLHVYLQFRSTRSI